jgi:hypothetical protein
VILLWSSDNSAESFASVVKTVQRLLALSLVNGTPLRGALSFGPLPLGLSQQPPQTHDFQQSLIGRELINSEKCREWSGCEVLEAAIAFYMKTCPAGKSLIEKEVVFYTIPKKDGERRGYAIDWLHNDCADIDFQTIPSAFAPPRDLDAIRREKFRNDEWPKVKNKMDNTVKFLKFLCAEEKTAFML